MTPVKVIHLHARRQDRVRLRAAMRWLDVMSGSTFEAPADRFIARATAQVVRAKGKLVPEQLEWLRALGRDRLSRDWVEKR